MHSSFNSSRHSNVNYATILKEMEVRLLEKWSNALGARISSLHPSDPAVKILEIAAYRELYIRQQLQEDVENTLIQYTTNGHLDKLATLFAYTRRNGESDEAFRQRILSSQRDVSPAGTKEAYKEAIAQQGNIKDVNIVQEEAGNVIHCTILFSAFQAASDQKKLWLEEIRQAVEEKRLITDNINIQEASLKKYVIHATLETLAGPGSTQIYIKAIENLVAYVQDHQRIGYTVSLAGLCHALHHSSVINIILEQPKDSIVTSAFEVPYCTEILLTLKTPTEVRRFEPVNPINWGERAQ